jgi:ribosomal protein S18 acetylase RimI-like enzyme
MLSTTKTKLEKTPAPIFYAAPLTEADRSETLEFLAARPLQTVILSGWIRDHGIVSPFHRGGFYGCRDFQGRLTGVALIGENTLFEVRTDEALRLLAQRAREFSGIRMMMAEGEKLAKFWRCYAEAGQTPRRVCRELLFRIGEVASDADSIAELRPATAADLDQVAAVHARMVGEETGVDPLAGDGAAFRARCSDRIAQGRVWVWVRNGALIFKTDVVSETPEAAYIEGLWVSPNERGQGHGKRCLTSLCRKLLNASKAVCGFVDAENFAAQALYRRAGFVVRDDYAKIYL